MRVISFFLLTLTTLVAQATDMTLATNMRGLPEDFRHYFYNSELIVQIYLNDIQLFDAVVVLKESGEIRLLRVVDEAQNVDPETSALWRGVLQKGIMMGQCVKDCPIGLMAVQYQLDNAVVKLFTMHYETSRVRNTYITIPADIPNGMIMYNDVSVTNTESMRSWGINSSLTSSFIGWSQKASFQSSGTEGKYHYRNSGLYELYTQKELPGSFVRLGYFTPDSDTGNVQTSSFGYETVAGFMWGTSDTLLVSGDSVSLWPVYVTGRNQSVAEIWRDGRLIHTQQLEAGVQALDTRQLPKGIYDITIRIIENGQTVDTQQAQIYKPQRWSDPNKRWRINLWSGQRRTLMIGDGRMSEAPSFSAGGGIDVLVHPRIILGVSGSATEKKRQVRTQINMTLSPDDTLFAQYMLGNTQYQANQSIDFRYYRNISVNSSASLFWRSVGTDVYGAKTTSHQQGDTWGSSMSLRLPRSTSFIINAQYINTTWRKGWAGDVSATTQATLLGHNMNFRVSAYNRPSFDNKPRDHGVSLGVSISLSPATRHTFSVETGMNQNQGYSSLNYQWQPEKDSNIRSLGGGISYSSHHTIISGNTSVDTPYMSGDIYLQHNTRRNINTAGANLSQALVMGGGKVVATNGNNSRSIESALIVDVDTDDKDTNIIVAGAMAETRLRAGRNIVPAELWKKGHIQFSANNGENIQVFPSFDNVQVQRGSVKYIRVKAVKTYTVVGMLQDESGNILKNRYVSSDVSGGVINVEGVITLDSGITNQKLTVKAENGQPAMECMLATSKDKNKVVQFVGIVKCRTEDPGEKNE